MDNKIYLILLCPILITVIKGFSIDVLYFLLIVIVYKYVNTYIQLAAKNEELLKMEQGLKNRLEEMVKERTAEIIKQNRVLDNLIKKDAATDTYNKNYFMEILEEQIQWIQNDRSPEIIAIVFIDLDKFKSINDIYGHRIGDQVIKKIANRLKKIQCMDSVLSRFGGDEFIMMVKYFGGKSCSIVGPYTQYYKHTIRCGALLP